MGLSLRNIVKKVGDVAGGVERQINPFDNGATYSNSRPPQPQFNTGGLSVNNTPNTQQIGFNTASSPPIQLTRPQPPPEAITVPTYVGAGNYSWSKPTPKPSFGVLGSLTKLATADITHNQLARAQASEEFKQANIELSQRAVDPNTAIALAAGAEGGAGKLKASRSARKPKAILKANGAKSSPELPAQTTEGLPQNQTPLSQPVPAQTPPVPTSKLSSAKTTTKNTVSQVSISPEYQQLINDYPRKLSPPDKQILELSGLKPSHIIRLQSKIEQAYKAQDMLTMPTSKISARSSVPSEAEFNKLIPATAGIKSPGAAGMVKLSQMTTEEKAALSSKEQMALAKFEGMGPPSLAPPEVNAARNPHQSNIQPLAQGDYHAARNLPGQVVNPIATVAHAWEYSMKQLAKTHPEEYTNFSRYFKDPGFADAPKSPELQQAMGLAREGANRVQAGAVGLGRNTNYLNDWWLHPELKNATPEQVATGGPGILGSHAMNRKYQTVADWEKATKQKVGDPLAEGLTYFRGSMNALHREAAVKGLAEADAGELVKPHSVDLGWGKTVQLSDKGLKQAKGLQKAIYSDNKVIKGARTANTAAKSSLLSLGQFHPINIGALRVAPTLAVPKELPFYRNAEGKMKANLTMGSHPVAAAKTIYRTNIRTLLPGGEAYSQRIMRQAISDGTVDKAAQIGMPYGKGGFGSEGSWIQGIGHHRVFDIQMQMAHDQTARTIINTLEKKGVDLGSREARDAGLAGNMMMGYINKEVQNLPPAARKAMSDWMLAGQFTPSKVGQWKYAVSKGGTAGNIARANVAANVIASTAIIAGLGYALHQKSDDIKDMLIRALTDPAVPTPLKDSKGNTIKLRLPGTDTSDLAKLLGIKPVRGADGHLSISWSPGNMPSTVADFARARLSPGASSAVKIATNSTFANKPLYDPQAPAGTKAAQAATTLGTGFLPIGLQGAAYTDTVKKHVPGSVRDVLQANTPGSSPIIKSVGSSFGLSPSTDQTVGKGLGDNRYFSATDSAVSQAKNVSEKTALQNYLGSKKNPVTGKYNVDPNANDTQRKSRDLLDAPHTIDILIAMNQKLTAEGSKVDPLWQSSKDEITKVLQYQAMPPGGPDRTHWYNQNQNWYQPLADQRGTFFSSLPKGDPNKPQAPIQYPDAPSNVVAAQKQFFAITDSKERASFLKDHPEVQTQLDAQVDYSNKMREATGYSALDTFPKAFPEVQKIIDIYNAIPKGGGSKGSNLYRAQWIQAHPKEYAAMTDYFTNASFYSLQKEAGQAQFKDTNWSQKGLKDIYNLGQYDIGKSTDNRGNSTYGVGAEAVAKAKASSKSSSGRISKEVKTFLPHNSYKFGTDRLNVKTKKTAIAKSNKGRPKVMLAKAKNRPKVSIKKAVA